MNTDYAPSDLDDRMTLKNSEEKGVAVAVHLGTLAAFLFSAGILHVLVPLGALFFMRNRSAFLDGHIREQLNFQLTLVIVGIVAVVGAFVTFGIGLLVAVPVLIVLFLTELVASIRAAQAASRGEAYRFPFSWRLIA